MRLTTRMRLTTLMRLCAGVGAGLLRVAAACRQPRSDEGLCAGFAGEGGRGLLPRCVRGALQQDSMALCMSAVLLNVG